MQNVKCQKSGESPEFDSSSSQPIKYVFQYHFFYIKRIWLYLQMINVQSLRAKVEAFIITDTFISLDQKIQTKYKINKAVISVLKLLAYIFFNSTFFPPDTDLSTGNGE